MATLATRVNRLEEAVGMGEPSEADVLASPEMAELAEAVLDALAPFPETHAAMTAVVRPSVLAPRPAGVPVPPMPRLVTMVPGWVAIRTRMLALLDADPPAKEAVMARLAEVTGTPSDDAGVADETRSEER